MKNKTILIFVGILLVGLVVADIGLSAWSKDINLTKEQEAQIKLSSNVDKIDINISKITCNSEICLAMIHQENVTHSQWVHSKYKCLNWTDGECVEEVEYTLTELQDLVSKYAEDKMIVYADAEIDRYAEKDNEEDKDDGGKLTTKTVVPIK